MAKGRKLSRHSSAASTSNGALPPPPPTYTETITNSPQLAPHPAPSTQLLQMTSHQQEASERFTRDVQLFAEDEELSKLRGQIPKWLEALARKAIHTGNLGMSRNGNQKWARVIVFGSSALLQKSCIRGVDIDLALVIPFTVKRQPFEELLFTALQEAGVKELVNVSSARIPLFKFTVNDLSVDVAIAQTSVVTGLPQDQAPPDTQLMVDYQAYTQFSRRVVNGVMTATALKKFIPQSSLAEDAFGTALIAVKTWATRRRVYGGLMTLLNGVGVAICVARAAARTAFPHDPLAIFMEFFDVLEEVVPCVRRDDNNAERRFIRYVHLPGGHIEQGSVQGVGESWSRPKPNGPEDAIPPVLAILDPAFPHTNKVFAMGRAAVESLTTELSHARRILDAQPSVGDAWRSLWAPYLVRESGFETVLYIDITHEVNGQPSAPLDAAPWIGYVESRIRFLIYALESAGSGATLAFSVRPLPGKMPHPTKGDGGATFAVALKRRPPRNKKAITAAQLQPCFAIFEAIIEKNCIDTSSANDEAMELVRSGSRFGVDRRKATGPVFRLETIPTEGEKQNGTKRLRSPTTSRPASPDSEPIPPMFVDPMLVEDVSGDADLGNFA